MFMSLCSLQPTINFISPSIIYCFECLFLQPPMRIPLFSMLLQILICSLTSARLLVSTSTTNSLVNLTDNSSSLFHLHYLQELSLAYSFYSSSIPQAFGNLTNLSYLNLSNAGFEISRLTIYFI